MAERLAREPRVTGKAQGQDGSFRRLSKQWLPPVAAPAIVLSLPVIFRFQIWTRDKPLLEVSTIRKETSLESHPSHAHSMLS